MIATERLLLVPLSAAEARAVVDLERTGRNWAADYPTEGDLVVAGLMVADPAAEAVEPYCAYQVVVREDDVVVGGAGFKGAPRGGAVEVGYGLAPSARGRGVATEAVLALVALALADPRVEVVEAEVEPGNVASARVLLRSGFALAGHREGSAWYRRTRE